MSKEIEKEAYKRIPLEILIHVTEFCKENNIRYSLAYGTLLGAIRHKGFIPWDDDIDIIMPRADYERFKRIYHSEKYPFSDMSVNNNHPTAMAKIYDSTTFYFFHGIRRSFGLFIDVFVVDNFPVNVKERRSWQRQTRFLISIYKSKNTRWSDVFLPQHSFRRKLLISFYKLAPVSKRVVQENINKLSQKYNNQETGIVGITMSCDNPYDTYPSNLFEEYVDVEFEGHVFKAIRQYDIWLTKCYHNYMQLPPVEKRIGRHGIVAYYK